MIHILHGFSNVDSEFKPRNLRQEVHYIESPRTKKRIVGWTIGCFRALYCSRRGETVFCWYDFQAVLLYWMCLLTFQRRNIGCLNILLKKKDTIQNRIVSKMYRKALMSKYFHASVTSYYYGELLKEWLCLDFNYTVIHDPYHEKWERKCESLSHDIFVGGGNSRDWSFMLEVAKQMSDVNFLFVMNSLDYRMYKEYITENIKVKCNLPFNQFLQEMANSAIVAMSLTTEAPAGLLVLFQAAGSERFVITTSTATTRAYITSDRGCALERDVKQWKDAIRYYLLNEKERNDKALKLHKFLKDVCRRDNFDSGIQKNVDLCESNY